MNKDSNLYEQIVKLCSYLKQHSSDTDDALTEAYVQIPVIQQDVEALRNRIKELDSANDFWLVAIPTDKEKPFDKYSRSACIDSYIALSADGSQIEPNRHGPHPAFLINIGKSKLGYGKYLDRCDLKSDPFLYFEEQDIRRIYGNEERTVSGVVLAALRSELEFKALSDLIKDHNDEAIAFIDGTMILWHIEANPKRLRELQPDDLKRTAFESFKQLIINSEKLKIPIAGYISAPGSNDVINALKVSICQYKPIGCKGKNCRDANGEPVTDRPCAKIDGITDATLFGRLLDVDERSALFKSRSEIIEAYTDNGLGYVYFFYLNVGREIARVEIPEWVAQDKSKVDQVHAICLDQAGKGRGYLPVIAEAHEQAVVRSADKEVIEQLILKAMIKHGLPIFESQKSTLKRRSPI